MSSGLILNHISASGNHVETINSVSQGVMYVSGAAAFAVPPSVGGESEVSWPGSDVTFFVSGSTSGTTTSAVFGGNVFVSGALSAGSITGGLSADATPAAKQVAIWTGADSLKGDSNLYWDDSDLVVNGNLQVQGSTTTISSSNMVIKDSIIGIGFSGSDGASANGDRGIVFGRGASASARLPGIFFDGAKSALLMANTKTSPSSGSFASSYAETDGQIRLPHTASDTNDLLDVHMGKFVSPVASYGSVTYPAISGSLCDVGGGTYSAVLSTSRLKVGSNVFLNYGGTTALRIDNSAKATFRDDGIYINSPADGILALSADGSAAALQLSASSGHVSVNASSLRPDVDDGSTLGTASVAWSDLFLADGGVINFNNGNATITHGTDRIAVKGHWVPDADSTYDLGSTSIAWDTVYADSVDLNGQGSLILDADGDTSIAATSDDVIVFTIGGAAEFEMDASSLYPSTDNVNDLGSAALRYRNIYTGDLNLQNDRGDWTLIEEQDFLSFRNNKTGRRYRMIMEDITGMGNYGPGNDGEM